MFELATIDTWVTAEPATPGDSWPQNLRVGAVAGLGMLHVDVLHAAPAMHRPSGAGGAFCPSRARVDLAKLEARLVDAPRGMTGDRTLLRE